MMGGLFGHQSAEACTVSVSGLNFGDVNPISLQSSSVDVTAEVEYRCSRPVIGLSNVCIEIAATGGQLNPRRLSHISLPSHQISFNVFKDSARGQIWGYRGGSYTPVEKNHNTASTISGTATIYGRLIASQQALLMHVGGYKAEMNVKVGASLLVEPCGGPVSGSTTLTATANILPACNVTANTLDFGVQPSNFTGPINSTSHITTHCSNGTNYQIALNNGLHSDGNIRRMKSTSGDYIPYELYQDGARTQRWGQTLNTSETRKLTSAGASQSSTVYGQVLPTSGLTAAKYEDTVTVTVTY